jgi:hypothetical protein
MTKNLDDLDEKQIEFFKLKWSQILSPLCANASSSNTNSSSSWKKFCLPTLGLSPLPCYSEIYAHVMFACLLLVSLLSPATLKFMHMQCFSSYKESWLFVIHKS